MSRHSSTPVASSAAHHAAIRQLDRALEDTCSAVAALQALPEMPGDDFLQADFEVLREDSAVLAWMVARVTTWIDCSFGPECRSNRKGKVGVRN
jgi:hypothetical protein